MSDPRAGGCKSARTSAASPAMVALRHVHSGVVRRSNQGGCRCGKAVRVIASIEEPALIERILAHAV